MPLALETSPNLRLLQQAASHIVEAQKILSNYFNYTKKNIR